MSDQQLRRAIAEIAGWKVEESPNVIAYFVTDSSGVDRLIIADSEEDAWKKAFSSAWIRPPIPDYSNDAVAAMNVLQLWCGKHAASWNMSWRRPQGEYFCRIKIGYGLNSQSITFADSSFMRAICLAIVGANKALEGEGHEQ